MEDQLKEIKAELATLFAEQTRINNRIAKLRNEEKEAYELIWSKKKSATLDELLENNGNNTTLSQVRMLAAILEPYYLRSVGYFPAINQSCIQIILYKRDSDDIIAAMAKGINEILPALKPQYNDSSLPGPCVIFDIFEHTLSQDCSWTLQYRPDHGDWTINGGRHPRYHFRTLTAALEAIREKHYYSDIRPECKKVTKTT